MKTKPTAQKWKRRDYLLLLLWPLIAFIR